MTDYAVELEHARDEIARVHRLQEQVRAGLSDLVDRLSGPAMGPFPSLTADVLEARDIADETVRALDRAQGRRVQITREFEDLGLFLR